MRTACDTAHVNSVFWLHLNMLQHVLGNSLQSGGVSLLTICLSRKLNWRLSPKTCCSMFRWSRNTDFTCAVSQAVRILKICKTFHDIKVPLNFLFKFTGINFVLVNIKPVEFHFIRLFKCQMMLNFLKHSVYLHDKRREQKLNVKSKQTIFTLLSYVA